MWRFAKAVLLGALASALVPTLFTTGLAVMLFPEVMRGADDAWRAAYLAALPLLVAIPVVFVSAVAVGLPVAAFLRWRRWESQVAYVSIAAATGVLVSLAAICTLHASNAYWVVLLGAVGGGVTAQVWWSSARTAKGQSPPKTP